MIDIKIDGRFKVTPTGKHIMSNEDYHADKHYFSSSQIKQALASPAHFKGYVLDKEGKSKTTTSMEFGTLVHTIILEPHRFDHEYVVHTGDVNQDGSVPKASAKILENKYPGLKPISKQQYDLACKARLNFERHPAGNDLLFHKSNEYEVSYFAQCNETGLRLRVRPDCINLENKVIVDLKTTSAKSKSEFKRDAVASYHYDLSAFMYRMVVYQLTGVVCDFYFAVVEKNDLMPAYIYKASEEFLDGGKSKFYKCVDNIATALTLPDNYRFQNEIEEI